MAFDAFLTTAQAWAAMHRMSEVDLRILQSSHVAELAQACAIDDAQGIQFSGGRLAMVTRVLECRAREALGLMTITDPAAGLIPTTVAPPTLALRVTPIADGIDLITDMRDVLERRRVAEIQLEDERKGD